MGWVAARSDVLHSGLHLLDIVDAQPPFVVATTVELAGIKISFPSVLQSTAIDISDVDKDILAHLTKLLSIYFETFFKPKSKF